MKEKKVNNHISLNVKNSESKPNTVVHKNSVCPFCDIWDGNRECFLLDKTSHFLWMENGFPVLKNDTYQTLIIETPFCDENFDTYSFEYAKELLTYAFEKRRILQDTGKFKQVLLFKNHGLHSDSSISHAHMQIIGLINPSYDEMKFEKHTKGPIAFENQNVVVTLSETPFSEFYEFNIIWSKKNNSFEFVEWIQTIIRFLQFFKNGKFKDCYNLAFHESNNHFFCKVIPRKPVSIYFVGYGLHQSPNDVSVIARDLYDFYLHSKEE